MPRYRVTDHTADLGVFFYGDRPEDVLVNAGLSLFALLVENPPRRGRETLDITAEGDDPADLLVCWLGELLYIFHSRHQVVTDIRPTGFTEKSLSASLTLAPFDPEKHGVRHDIKAVTYHRVSFRPYKDRWRGRVVFDL